MKKILCIIDNLGAGGAQRQLVGLASFLFEKGYDVTVGFYHENNFYVDLLVEKGIPFVYLDQAHKSWKRIWSIARYIRKEKPDVVIAYLETPAICASMAHLFNRKFRLIVSERNTTQKTGFKEYIRFNLFRFADLIVANSYSQSNYIKKKFRFLKNKVQTIPNFVDLDIFLPLVSKIRRSVPEVMVAATIWSSKNTLGLIEAVTLLKEKGYKFHVSWYGKSNETDTQYYNLCINKINENKVEDFISLKDKTNKIRDLYQDADFFCLPSFYEGTPNVICEAMACGLPIVCSDVCDNSKYVIEGENGFLFTPDNPYSMCAAFEKMFSLSSREYETFSVQSRTMAEQNFSKESFIQSYIKIIEL